MKQLLILFTLMVLCGCSSEPEVRVETIEKIVYKVLELGELKNSRSSVGYDSLGGVIKVTTTKYYNIIDSVFSVGFSDYNVAFCFRGCGCKTLLSYGVAVCSSTVDTVYFEQKECIDV